MKKKLTYLAWFLCGIAFAASQVFILTWNKPTTRIDGTPLAPEEISHYVITVTFPDGITQKVYQIDGEDESAFLNLNKLVGTYTFEIITCDTQETSLCSPEPTVVTREIEDGGLNPPTGGSLDAPTDGSLD